MEKDVFVYVDLGGVPHLVGRLWARVRKNKEGATFKYNDAWLKHPSKFSLEPALKLGPGPFHTVADAPMFGAIGDSAPDRWGRALMRRMERRRAEREGQAPRTLFEMDYLLMVDDEARMGALRFSEAEGGPFLRQEEAKRIPPLLELPKLLSAAEHVMDETDTEEDLRLLFAPGSSLGGARPKASVRDKDGHLEPRPRTSSDSCGSSGETTFLLTHFFNTHGRYHSQRLIGDHGRGYGRFLSGSGQQL